MDNNRGENLHIKLGRLILTIMAIVGLGLQGCQQDSPATENDIGQPAEIVERPEDPLSTPTIQPAELAETIATENLAEGNQPLWEDFLPPSIDPATAIPSPLRDLEISDEILVWVLLGSDTEPPFTGRTQAIHVLFIHPRFSKASLVSIPGDLYVYIPGYTMQRLNAAYALGGIETLRSTLTYNFGITPSRFVLAHPGDFQWLVDDIRTIDVTVFYPIPHVCGGIPAGLIQMDGALALCYASYRDGMDEIDRMRRQQQLLRVIFRKFSRDGNLVQLPVLYASYEGWVKTDVSLTELMDFIPFALRLADPDRISYFMIGWDQISIWQVHGYSQAQVFLPDQEGINEVLQQAINAVLIPSPLTNQVQTLEAQLTAAYQMTMTAIATPTQTITSTPFFTDTLEATSTGEPHEPTPTVTPIGYP